MLELKVDGMTCQGCVKSVTNAVIAVDGNASVTIDLPSKMVSVSTDKSIEVISATIEAAGFDVLESKTR